MDNHLCGRGTEGGCRRVLGGRTSLLWRTAGQRQEDGGRNSPFVARSHNLVRGALAGV